MHSFRRKERTVLYAKRSNISLIFFTFVMFVINTCMISRKLPPLYHLKDERVLTSLYLSSSIVRFARGRRRLDLLVPNAKNSKSKKKPWWERFFLDEDNWFGLEEDDMLEEPEESSHSEDEGELSEEDKFEAWKRRAEAIIELREAQEDMRNSENREWEDWVGGPELTGTGDSSSFGIGWKAGTQDYGEEPPTTDPDKLLQRKTFDESVRALVLGDEDDFTYEDRVFQYASRSSAKFLALLIIIPWVLDFVVHDYVLMPFLDRYVKKVPLAAQLLDVRKNQKLEIMKTLKLERARFRLEVVIGKSPPLSDEEIWWELRDKALELKDEWRLENRKAFANIWSDMIYGIVLFLLVYFNQSKVALLKVTGYKILANITDTGKAFLIILITDIFLGYHSESGWQTLIEVILEHYGLELDEAAITIFVCFVPVVMDACVKLWLFKFLPKLSPKVSNIFREMKRH